MSPVRTVKDYFDHVFRATGEGAGEAREAGQGGNREVLKKP